MKGGTIAMNRLAHMLLPIAFLAAPGMAVAAPQPEPADARSEAIKAKAPLATETALKRARADMACPAATGSTVSAQRLKPNFTGPKVSTAERAEYTVKATGCGKQKTLKVICADDGTDCYVSDPGAK
jgi:hypothetical protein